MAEAPRFHVREIELYERPVVLRLPFRFGVVTLRECPQAFVRARIEFADGKSTWGAAAEMMAPKWFDKNLQLSNEDNFDQLRDVLRLARDAYLGDGTPASAFGHFARHHDGHLAAATARGYNPLLASYGPALVDRAVLDALCRSRVFPLPRPCKPTWPASALRGRSSPPSTSTASWPACNPVPPSRRGTPSAWSTRSPRPTSPNG